MASPLKIFRRNQKAWLAVLGVMVIIGFVIIPAMMQGLNQRSIQDPVVVKTAKFDNLTERQLHNLRWQRQGLIGFCNDMAERVFMARGNPQAARYWSEQFKAGFDKSPEQFLVDRWLLAREAEKMGLVESNENINSFLEVLTDNRIPFQTLREDYFNRGRGFTEEQLFAALREELSARRLEEMFKVSIQSFTPAQRWDYYCRLNRKATVELAGVKVKDFTAKVAVPDDATLEKFFEKHKSAYAAADSPEPGFHVPHRVALQYLIADVDKFTDPKAVSDAEVKQEYEKNKEEYDRRDALMPEEKPEKKSEKSPGRAGGVSLRDAEKAEKSPGRAGGVSLRDGKKSEKGEKPQPQPAKPQPKSDQPPKPTADKPAAEKKDLKEPAVKAPADKPAADQNKEPAKPAPEVKPSGKTSSIDSSSPFRLTAFAADAKPAEEKKPIEEKKPAEKKETATEKKPTDEKKPVEEKKPSAEKKPQEEPAGQPSPAKRNRRPPRLTSPSRSNKVHRRGKKSGPAAN